MVWLLHSLWIKDVFDFDLTVALKSTPQRDSGEIYFPIIYWIAVLKKITQTQSLWTNRFTLSFPHGHSDLGHECNTPQIYDTYTTVIWKQVPPRYALCVLQVWARRTACRRGGGGGGLCVRTRLLKPMSVNFCFIRRVHLVRFGEPEPVGGEISQSTDTQSRKRGRGHGRGEVVPAVDAWIGSEVHSGQRWWDEILGRCCSQAGVGVKQKASKVWVAHQVLLTREEHTYVICCPAMRERDKHCNKQFQVLSEKNIVIFYNY